MLATLRRLLALIRFSHTIFALPFAMLAAMMAWYLSGWDVERTYTDLLILRDSRFLHVRVFADGFSWWQLFGILLCMVAARSAAMAFNRIADRRFDAENPRTEKRHLVTGELSIRTVTGFAAGCSVVFVAATLLFLPNWLPLALSLPVLAYLLAYSYTKRFTALAHFWLGAALMLAPVSAWIGIRGLVLLKQPADILPAVVLGGGVLFWVAGFDIIYACQDAAFDRAAKLKSVPTALGVKNALRLAALCHAAAIALLAVLPFVFEPFGWFYWIGVAGIAGLLVYEHLLVRPDDLTRVNVAFFNVNAVISLGLLLIGSIDLLL